MFRRVIETGLAVRASKESEGLPLHYGRCMVYVASSDGGKAADISHEPEPQLLRWISGEGEGWEQRPVRVRGSRGPKAVVSGCRTEENLTDSVGPEQRLRLRKAPER